MGYYVRAKTLTVRSLTVLICCSLALASTACKPRPTFKKTPPAQNTAASRSTVTVPTAAKAYALKAQQDKQRQREAATAGTTQYDGERYRCNDPMSYLCLKDSQHRQRRRLFGGLGTAARAWLGPTSNASSADPVEAVRTAKAQLGTDRCVCACFQSATGEWYAWAEAVP